MVTFTSDHLEGAHRVRERLRELATLLPGDSRWTRYVMPTGGPLLPGLDGRTCLPCQRSYVAAGTVVALHERISTLAVGYSAYQSDWPEQSPAAIAALTSILAERSIRLLLPLQDVRSKEDAKSALLAVGLSAESREQKCTKQVSNVALAPEVLHDEIARWGAGISAMLDDPSNITLRVIEDATLRSWWGRDA